MYSLDYPFLWDPIFIAAAILFAGVWSDGFSRWMCPDRLLPLLFAYVVLVLLLKLCFALFEFVAGAVSGHPPSAPPPGNGSNNSDDPLPPSSSNRSSPEQGGSAVEVPPPTQPLPPPQDPPPQPPCNPNLYSRLAPSNFPPCDNHCIHCRERDRLATVS